MLALAILGSAHQGWWPIVQTGLCKEERCLLPMDARIVILPGTITQRSVDAIVNAANSSLLGGGGVDGAIHRAAGPQLAEACRSLGRCATGDAKITPAFRLPAKWVIHTVGPVWQGGHHQEELLLARCYQRCFQIADAHQITTLAFPSISTGRYRFPIEKAAKIALDAINAALASRPTIDAVEIVCFEPQVQETYAAVRSRL